MIAAAFLVPLAAFAAMQARLDAIVQHHARIALETFTVAESGLEHAVADFTADPRFERLLMGPDRVAGTPDDREYPFRSPPPAYFPRQPFGYLVQASAPRPDIAEIRARGFGPLGAARVLVATVARSATPFVPGALALAASGVRLDLGSQFRISGRLPAADDPGLPAVAVDDPNAAAAMSAALPPDAAPRLSGRGGSPSIEGTAVPGIDGLAEAAARRSGARVLEGDVRGAIGDGLFVSPTALRMADVSGSGILVARGPLDLSGICNFSGLIVALGDVRSGLGSDVAIAGAVLVGAAGSAVSLRGGGHIAYDARVIEAVDTALPGLLPRRARVTSWREDNDGTP